MALVEDGEHRIVGLVTLEDLMEEIVGDLTDEFDHLSDEIIEVADRRWKVGGGARLADVLGQTGVHLSAADLSITLCDWLQQRQGREPRVGDSVKEGTVQFTVIQTRRRKANRVLVEAP